jgi:outer membrane receptor protein involved in Fe transport
VNRETSASFYSNGEKASGRITYTNLDSEGIVDFTDQRQNTISANINLTPNSKLTTTANVTYLRKESDNIPAASYSKWADIFGWLQRDYPTQYAKDLFYEKGNEDYIFPGGDNPFYGLRNTNELSRERMFGNISTTYKINDWLSASARIGVDSYHQKQKRITQSGTKKNIRQGKGGQFEENKNSFRETNADITLNFDKTFGDYRVDGLIGANNRNTVSSWSKMKALDLTVADIYSISNVNGTPELGMSSSEYETQSIYASVNSSYKDYLYLGLTYRLDWSSTLPPDNWSFPYYSISTGLDLTNALDLESNLLSYAKLRGSIAKVGGDTGPYQLVKTYSGSFYNSISKYNPLDILPENNLMPEETVSYEFGADLRLLDDRISVDVTYYNQNTVNQILDIKTSTTTGYAAMKKNAAEVSNKGVELMVFGKVLENKSGLNWDVTLNWATNKSIVKSLWGNLESYVISTGFGGAKSLGIPGEEWGVIWGLPFVRNDAGKVVVDSRGIPKTAASGQKLGTITPDWTGGITNSFRYKGVNLSFMVDAKMGGDFFSCSAWHSYPTGSYEVTTANNVRETGLIVDGVFEDGTPNDVRVSAQDYYGGGWMWNNHEYSVLDGSYIKLREFVLGYNFDVQQIKWIQKLNISLVGRNLAILYQDKSTKDLGLDPEVGFGGTENGVGFENFQIPTSRSFGIKLKVSF